MTTKLIKEALVHIASAAIFTLPVVAMADMDMTNPVTGETETYVNTFTGGADGTATEWNSTDNWDPSVTPFIANTYTPSLVSNKTVSTSTAIDGWALRVGAYNGANVTWSGGITKIQASNVGCWLTADETSSITLAFNGNSKQLEGSDAYPFKLSSAKAGGITWTSGLADAGNTSLPFWYYLKGAGTVVYGGSITVPNAQVIKQADVTLSGNSQVSSKTLVSFTASAMTFTADAAIKVYGTDGTTLVTTVNLATVNTTGTTTLTLDSSVGTCELVQTSTGIVLYWVDGDPAAIVPKTYTPSININFCFGDAPLTTAADVGYSGYAVPGTSWNNMTSTSPANGNGTFTTPLSTVYAVKADGTLSLVSGASVALSGTPGSYRCGSLAAATDLRHGYIDENANNTAPTVTVSGIPYDKYKVVVYTSTDTADSAFGYISVNGKDYTYVSDALTEGTTAWGASGADNSANAIAEGVNMLVTPTISGATATIVGHKLNGRGCIAAVQIVKVEQQVGENDLLIELDGDRTYTFDEAKAYSGTVYVLGEGTLTFDGAASTAATLHIGPAAAVNMVDSALTPATVTGSGTVVYDGVIPPTDKDWTDSANWTGTVWIKNKSGITGNDTAGTGVQPNNLGNANSKVKFSGVSGWLEAPITYTPEIVLEDDAYDYALKLTNGNSPDNKNSNENRCTVIKKLSGSGKVTCGEPSNSWPTLKVYDASAYTGDIDCGSSGTCLVVVFAAEDETLPDTLYALFNSAPRSIYISANGSATVASGATWTAKSGITVNGTLYANGTLASSAASAVSGSGTVVFTGRLPTPVDGSNETKWWKNANWTGTVQIDSLSGFIGTGTGTVLAPNDYGNTGSTLELKNCSGWLPVNYECTVPLSVAGTLTIGNGYSGIGNAFTIDHLKGNGQITCNGSAPTVLIYVREWSGYTGKIKMDNKMIVFGDDTVTTSDLVSGTIYICEGAVVTNLSNSHWEPAASMKVNGTFAVKARSGWTDGKGAVLGENGIINFIGSGVDDHAYNFSNITGSGKILFTNGTGYSMLPSDANRMPSTDVAVVNDNTESYVVLTCTGTTTIGTLSGSGKFDSRYGNATTRRLAVVQGVDSVWSGTFVNDDRVGGMYVSAKSGATAKTLTLSGVQTANNELVVQAATENTDAGSVNLTGTWVGDTTVSGTIGGTGTLMGNLTFGAGSTFKLFETDPGDGLNVSGTINYPGSGTVTVDVGGLDKNSGWVTLITASPASDLDVSKFAPSDADKYKIRVVGNQLQARTRVKKFCVIVR